MLTQDDLEQIGWVIDKRFETQTVTITATIKTEIAASEKRIRADMATKTDISAVRAEIQDLKASVTKKLKSHERRLNALEDEVGVPHPDKN